MKAGTLKFGVFTVILSIVMDQVSKQAALGYFSDHPAITVLPILNLTLAWNKGVSFGMFGGGGVSPWVFVLISLAIAGFLGWQMVRSTTRLSLYGFAFIIGGALGNIIDRAVYSAVIDFIQLHWRQHAFPVFNIADTAITLGVCLILIDSLWSKPTSTTS